MKNLKKLRKEKKLTQQRLADRLNVTRSTVSMWEIDASRPDYDMLDKVANFFEVDVNYLVGKTNDPRPPNKKSLDEPKKREPDILWENIGISFYEGGDGDDLSDEEKEELLDLVKFAREQRRKRREKQKEKERE